MRQARLERRRRNRNTTTVTEYERHGVPPAPCRWRIPDPGALLDRVVVLKKPDPELWKRVRTRVVHISVLVLIDRTADIRGNVAS